MATKMRPWIHQHRCRVCLNLYHHLAPFCRVPPGVWLTCTDCDAINF